MTYFFLLIHTKITNTLLWPKRIHFWGSPLTCILQVFGIMILFVSHCGTSYCHQHKRYQQYHENAFPSAVHLFSLPAKICWVNSYGGCDVWRNWLWAQLLWREIARLDTTAPTPNNIVRSFNALTKISCTPSHRSILTQDRVHSYDLQHLK